MIISHSKKFIFFRPTKTGSTTADVLLRLSGAFDPEQDMFAQTKEWEMRPHNIPSCIPDDITDIGVAHATPQRLIDWGVMTLEQLREYDCYAFLRPVESRFVAGYLHCVRRGSWGKIGKAGFQPTQFMQRWRERANNFTPKDLLGMSQTSWFFVGDEQVVTPLDFRKYQVELRRLLDIVGGYQFPEIPRINRAPQHMVIQNENRREWAESIWTDYDEIQREVLECYADDHAFYVSNFGEKNGHGNNRVTGKGSSGSDRRVPRMASVGA
jgi:hypothetical protein